MKTKLGLALATLMLVAGIGCSDDRGHRHISQTHYQHRDVYVVRDHDHHHHEYRRSIRHDSDRHDRDRDDNDNRDRDRRDGRRRGGGRR